MLEKLFKKLGTIGARSALAKVDFDADKLTSNDFAGRLLSLNPIVWEVVDVGMIVLTDDDAAASRVRRYFSNENYVLVLPLGTTREEIIDAVIDHYPPSAIERATTIYKPFRVWEIRHVEQKDEIEAKRKAAAMKEMARIQPRNPEEVPDPYAGYTPEQLKEELITMNGLWSTSATENTKLRNRLSTKEFETTWYERLIYSLPLGKRVMVKAMDGTYCIGTATQLDNGNIEFHIDYELVRPKCDVPAYGTCWISKWKICKLPGEE